MTWIGILAWNFLAITYVKWAVSMFYRCMRFFVARVVVVVVLCIISIPFISLSIYTMRIGLFVRRCLCSEAECVRVCGEHIEWQYFFFWYVASPPAPSTVNKSSHFECNGCCCRCFWRRCWHIVCALVFAVVWLIFITRVNFSINPKLSSSSA